jgi:hypothetical protein
MIFRTYFYLTSNKLFLKSFNYNKETEPSLSTEDSSSNESRSLWDRRDRHGVEQVCEEPRIETDDYYKDDKDNHS